MADSKEIADELARKARNIAELHWFEHKRPPDAADFADEFKQILDKHLHDGN